MLRFLGTKPLSSDIEKLLISLIRQIGVINHRQAGYVPEEDLNQKSKNVFRRVCDLEIILYGNYL